MLVTLWWCICRLILSARSEVLPWGTCRTAWAVQPCCRCSYSYGSEDAVGPQASGNWEFLRGLWRAVAPLMAPWCTDREVPVYGCSGSRVRWHGDDEGLFGKRRESKLIVSMSFGASALERTGEYHFSMAAGVGVACPHARRVHSCLPTRIFSFQVSLLLVVQLTLLGWALSFLVALFPLCLELRCRASCCCLFCWVRREFGGRSSRGGCNSVGFIW